MLKKKDPWKQVLLFFVEKSEKQTKLNGKSIEREGFDAI